MAIDYDKTFQSFLYGATISSYSGCPVERDLFIIGSDDFNRIIPNWVAYLDGTQEDHPNNFIDYIHGSCRFTDSGVLDVFTEINISDRFHGVCKKLLEKDFIYCFQFFHWDEKPYVVVSQEWFDRVKTDNYSTYGMIDIVGVKKLLETNGIIEKGTIVKYRKAIDAIASEESGYTFITFTDNIFIKSNWSTIRPGYASAYNPEYFLSVVKRVQEIIFAVFELKSYAIVAQGIQLFEDDNSTDPHTTGNHFFIGSIATPFIELFDIEGSIKSKIKEDASFRKNLYLSKSFLLSLKIKSQKYRDELLGSSTTFQAKNSGVSMNSFVAIDIEEVLKRIEERKI